MRILILGGDGYLGWPTAMHFSARGHDVGVLDNMIKRQWEAEVGAEPLFPIPTLARRISRWKTETGKNIDSFVVDMAENPRGLYNAIEQFQPDTVVHYAEQPSAPFSMMNRAACVETQVNNIVGTLNLGHAMMSICPNAHLIKLGTMGEYGTPNIDIEEGWLEITHNGRSDRVLFPKRPGSFYHLSKVHDSQNLEFMSRVWGLRVTDLNQGVVYGVETEETGISGDLRTSFHYDAVFGTVLNRFVTMAAIGHPLTVYGQGGQTRGYLNIRDTLRCVELAAQHPAGQGEFRVFNQFTETFTVSDLAERVVRIAKQLGLAISCENLPNPRVEAGQHRYKAANSALLSLGLKPNLLTDDMIAGMIQTVARSHDSVDRASLKPTITWRQDNAREASV